MHEIAVNADIDFHEQEILSIFHETNQCDTDEHFAEIAFAGAFTIRMMSNLGNHEVTDALAHQLKLISQAIVDMPQELTDLLPTIIAYPGHAGRKRFISKLRLTKNTMRLAFSAKGFGWLATGVGYYGTYAVLGLYRYFAARHFDDDRYRNALAYTAAICAQLQLTRQIRVTNHAELQSLLFSTSLSELLPSWMQSSESDP